MVNHSAKPLIDTAIIIAGGKGTRMHPVTGDRIPKALLPIAVPAAGWGYAREELAITGVLVALPLLALLDTALERGLPEMIETVGASSAAVWASVWSSAAATILGVGLGTTVALMSERTELPGRRWLRVAMLVAFIVPGYVAAMGWLAAFGPGGLLDDVFGVACG